jgi:integrase
LKKFERLRSFFLFCENNGWSGNPCKGLKPPKVQQNPTLPFTQEEIGKILGGCEIFGTLGRYRAANRNRVRAMVLLLRYSGLRIRDAVMLERRQIQNGRVFLRTAKTGTQVYLPLPDFVVAEMESLKQFPDRFFWNGSGKIESAVGVWERTMKRLFEIAGIEGGHCHRFRDSFSVALLEKGVSIETVAVLLGHSDIRVTQKHYAPFVQTRQALLEEAVRRTW